MPELPEVETMRRGVLPIVGSRIQSAVRPPCPRKPISFQPSIKTFNQRCQGKKISDVDRLGKRVILRLDDGQAIVMEPRMTGLVLLSDPPTTEHLRFRLNLNSRKHPQMLFWDRRGLGTVSLLREKELTELATRKLGIDALKITADEIRDLLKHSRRAIKVALLDQSVVAGIGNLYAAEILFVAGVDPRTRCDKITRRQWQRIIDGTRMILIEAIEHEGSTLSDGTYRNALNDSGNYQNYHRVYDRADEACIRCQGGQIRRIVQAQRSTFFCPNCQRKSGLHESVA